MGHWASVWSASFSRRQKKGDEKVEGPLTHEEWYIVYRMLVSSSCVTQSCRNVDDGDN